MKFAEQDLFLQCKIARVPCLGLHRGEQPKPKKWGLVNWTLCCWSVAQNKFQAAGEAAVRNVAGIVKRDREQSDAVLKEIHTVTQELHHNIYTLEALRSDLPEHTLLTTSLRTLADNVIKVSNQSRTRFAWPEWSTFLVHHQKEEKRNLVKRKLEVGRQGAAKMRYVFATIAKVKEQYGIVAKSKQRMGSVSIWFDILSGRHAKYPKFGRRTNYWFGKYAGNVFRHGNKHRCHLWCTKGTV